MKNRILDSNNAVITYNVTATDLERVFEKMLIKSVEMVLDSKKEKLFTRQEVIDLFQVSPATLWRWDNLGIIKGKKIGNRRYYTENEVNKILTDKK